MNGWCEPSVSLYSKHQFQAFLGRLQLRMGGGSDEIWGVLVCVPKQ